MHRRDFFNTAAVAAAASLPGCTLMSPAAASIRKAAPYIPAAETDPLIELIERYRRTMAEFNARAGEEAWEVLMEATYGPSFEELRMGPPAPTTFAGAQAGIEFVLDELAHQLDSDANEAVLRVCASFLRHTAGGAA